MIFVITVERISPVKYLWPVGKRRLDSGLDSTRLWTGLDWTGLFFYWPVGKPRLDSGLDWTGLDSGLDWTFFLEGGG